MKRIFINGDRACLPIDGMNRALLELIKGLDKYAKKGRYVLVIPANVNEEFLEGIKGVKNIGIKRTGLPFFRFWTFLNMDLPGALFKRIVIDPANRNSIFGGGINILHDIIPLRFYGEREGKYFKRLMRLLKSSDCLIVPSEAVRDDIEETLGCRCRIRVIRLGWQHYRDIGEDPAVFDEYPCLERGEYYFTISALSPHKNLRFIYEAAKRNPDRMFVIAGAMNRGPGFPLNELKNLLFVGRIDDRRAKALMMDCRAFIFPSLCEGAGLPPLEALSCGVPVLAADIRAVREYCGDSVHYFDPLDYEADLDEVLKTKVSKPEKALDRLSWDRASKELKDLVEEIIC